MSTVFGVLWITYQPKKRPKRGNRNKKKGYKKQCKKVEVQSESVTCESAAPPNVSVSPLQIVSNPPERVVPPEQSSPTELSKQPAEPGKPAEPAVEPVKTDCSPAEPKSVSCSSDPTEPASVASGRRPPAGDSDKRVEPAGDMPGDIPAPEHIPANPEHPTSCEPTVAVPSVRLDPPDTPPRTEQLDCAAPTNQPPHQQIASPEVAPAEASPGDAVRSAQVSNESEEFLTPLVNNEPDPLGMVLAAGILPGAARSTDVPINIDESLTETSKEETSVTSTKSSENVAPPENKGKLRLALSYDSDSLIVSILEACDVHVPSSDTSSNPYVKISLIPSTEGGDPKLEHQTKVATNTKEPAFRETFLVKIEEGDSSQRLLVSLWNQGDVEDYSCGGMSFSIDEYAKPNTSVNGWYYLLDDQEAEKSNSRCVQPVKNHVVSTNKISLAADKRPVKIQRNTKGLGFAVVSDGPVIVTSVENGGPAAAGGLLKGDMILAVNGKEVSDLSCAYVSKLLRQCGDSVEMVVQQAPRDMLSNPCYTPDLMNGAKDKDHTSLPPVVLDWETLPPLEQKRQQAIQDLIRSEDHYLTDLKFGIERYLLPLKKKEFLSPEKHEKMFNNIKEVADITNKVLKSLTISRVPLINTSPNLPYYIYSIGEVYRENSAELIQQYEEYLNGRKAAHQEFNRLHNVGEFMTFLQEPPALPDLCNILQQPREHIGSLPCLLQGVLSATPLHHPDQAHLGHVIQVLSALSRTSPSKKKSEARKMADIQERLIFSSSVKPFPIKEGDRVLVHEGSLYKLDKKKKHKVYAMLFTDLLLLTKEVGQHLKVVQDPMFLSQIMIQDFNCDDGTEFHITVVATLPSEGDKVIHGDTYVLRGKTAESKEIWKKVIGDRASGVDRLTQKPKDPNIYNLPCLPTPIPDPDHSTSEPEVDDMGVPIWDGVSKGNNTKNDKKPGKKDCTPGTPSAEQCKRWQESLENVLHDPKGEAHFLRFLKKEFCAENFEFWKDVKQLKKKNPQGDKLKKDVKNIYDNYIGESALKQINVNGKLKVAIRDAVDEPYLEMFDDAQKFVIQLMRDGPYRRFIDEDNLAEILKGHG